MKAGERQVAVSDEGDSGRSRAVTKSRYMAIVEYDGTEYLGFQIQGPASARRSTDQATRATDRTIQGELERSLLQVTQHATRVVGAGRTDAGVHAEGQVIHFDVPWSHPIADLQRALNAVLVHDIAVVELRLAASNFHARFDARSRQYLYTILNRKVRSPLAERFALHVAQELDAEEMNRACACLVGRHDFLAFGWPPHGENTVRTVLQAGCSRSGDLVRVEMEADAFLRSMVRRVVGNLLLVGLGELSVEGMAGLLSLGHRRTPAVAVPAQGLCLIRVDY
jgi:tRNA pseudouridine38-40 synthase